MEKPGETAEKPQEERKFVSLGGGVIQYQEGEEVKFGFRIPYMSSFCAGNRGFIFNEKRVQDFGDDCNHFERITIIRMSNGPPYVVSGDHAKAISALIAAHNAT